jgi:hypothetical protein
MLAGQGPAAGSAALREAVQMIVFLGVAVVSFFLAAIISVVVILNSQVTL